MPTTPPESRKQVNDERALTQGGSNRRDFLKCGAYAVGAGVATLIIGEIDATMAAPEAAATPRPAETPPSEYDWTKHQYIYLIDLRKCIGCGACVRACSLENDVPADYFRTWVERYHGNGFDEPVIDSPNGGMDGFEPLPAGQNATKAFFFPKLCGHCTHSPCTQLCPVGASYSTQDGVVLVDDQRCIGCGYCVQACPYGSRFMHPDSHTASKCTLCYHRLTRGLKTACVQACPVGARMLGDSRTVGDYVTGIIATQRVGVLQPELLTEPNCYYLGLTREAR